MPASRTEPPRKPVKFTLDGDELVGDEGEPLAQALVASDKLTLARSPKLHRPRGPWCMRGGCDGCLMRVDGVPNVMTCLVRVSAGTRVETQNVLGSRTTDLLRVTDWFFPDGIDHHHLMAGVPGLSTVMQSFARRVAGLGTLPDRPGSAAQGSASSPDALVVGGGPAGVAAASSLARRGLAVTLVDDGPAPGGGARALGSEAVEWLLTRCPLDRVRVLASTTAAGVYRDEAGRASCLVVGEGASELITPRALILATGAHDGGFLFENNDLPGVFAARAAALLAAAGVAVGQRVALAGRGPFSAALKRHLAGKAEIDEIDPATLLKAEGSSRVGAVVVLDGQQPRRVRCDALVIEAPPAPSFELAEQAGAAPVWAENRGFWPPGEAGAAVAPGVWVAGEARGASFDLRGLVDEGERAAAAVV